MLCKFNDAGERGQPSQGVSFSNQPQANSTFVLLACQLFC
tara:strand:- start:629 stop:748 length:120 start_codon:yes stop_codon:yes gene_type:complete